MRIRTIHGPPLPAEIAEQAARTITLTEMHAGKSIGATAPVLRYTPDTEILWR